VGDAAELAAPSKSVWRDGRRAEHPFGPDFHGGTLGSGPPRVKRGPGPGNMAGGYLFKDSEDVRAGFPRQLRDAQRETRPISLSGDMKTTP
jgi:hypothetical protein